MSRLFLCLAGLSSLFSTGCNREDPERLAGVGRKLGERIEMFRDYSQHQLALRPSGEGALVSRSSLERRVVARLRYDENLAGARIETVVKGDTIELRGTVQNELQRRRAVDLTQSTSGVETVLDTLVIGASAPE